MGFDGVCWGSVVIESDIGRDQAIPVSERVGSINESRVSKHLELQSRGRLS